MVVRTYLEVGHLSLYSEQLQHVVDQVEAKRILGIDPL